MKQLYTEMAAVNSELWITRMMCVCETILAPAEK